MAKKCQYQKETLHVFDIKSFKLRKHLENVLPNVLSIRKFHWNVLNFNVPWNNRFDFNTK